MRTRTVLVLSMVGALGAAASHGDWRLRIHKGTTVEEHTLADIDSLTLYDHLFPSPVFVTVPAGAFVMGDGFVECGVDERDVTLTRDFHLSDCEITNRQYMEAVQWAHDHGYVVATTYSVRDNLDGCSAELLDLASENCEIQFDGARTFYLRESPSSFARSAYPGGYDPEAHPVKEVTWFGAVRYCDWLSLLAELPRAYEHTGDWSCNGGDPYGAEGYRLPTDAEWEYAARFDDERMYPWGNNDLGCLSANYSAAWPQVVCVGWTSPVGSYPPAPEALGLADMAGNLWEWCNDWWVCGLGTAPVTNPTGPGDGISRLIRGGSWSSIDIYVRCAARMLSREPGHSSYSIGFRVARTVAP